MKSLRRGSRHGFTLIELLIVIAVIGILTTIAVVAFSAVQANSRDNVRAADVESIHDSLEAYYSKNGEYPGCTVINSSTAVLSTLPNITQQELTAPKATTQGASLKCASSLAVGTDAYVYVGDGSTTCNTGSNCRYYTLEYWSESSNSIISVASRHQAQSVAVEAPSGPSSTVSYSGTQASGKPNTVTCAAGTPQYAIRSRLDSGATGTTGTWSSYTSWVTTPAALLVTATQGDRVYYQSEARCQLSSEYNSGAAAGSAVAQLVAISAPAAPVVSVDSTTAPNTALWSWTTVACPSSFTPTFRYDWYKDDATGWRAWSGAVTATSQSEDTTNQGYNYQFKVDERCSSAFVTGNWSADSNTSAYLHAVAAPATPSGFSHSSSRTGTTSGYTHTITDFWWTPGTCGSGTVKRTQLLYYQLQQIYYPSSPSSGWQTALEAAFLDGMFTNTGDLSTTAEWNAGIADWKSSTPATNLTSTYSSSSSVAASDLTSASGTYNTGWVTWQVTSSVPFEITSIDYSSSSADSRLTNFRIYARDACLNTTTKRFAVSGYAFSPLWTGISG